MSTEKLINILIIVLSICLASALVLSISAIFGFYSLLKLVSDENLNLLPGVAIASAGLIAILAYLRDSRNQKISVSRKRDEIYLSQVREAFEEVYELLKDHNNENVVWVRAARLLLRGLDLQGKISTGDIKETSFLVEESFRSKLYRLLEYKPEEDGAFEPLPPQFFYGISDWRTEKSLDEAAKKASSKIMVSNVTLDVNIPTPSGDAISSKAVIAIYNFLEYPSDFTDPLDSIENWEDDWTTSHGIDQGARRYIHHKSNTFAIDGKIHKK